MMTKERKSNRSSCSMERKVNLCVNECVAQVAKLIIGCRTSEDVVRILKTQLSGARCCVTSVNVAQYDPKNDRLCCGMRSKKFQVNANTLYTLKDAALKCVNSQHEFDCLLVSAMWTNGAGESRIYYCDRDRKSYIYQSYQLKGWSGHPAVIRFKFKNDEYYWIEINCPDNMLTAYSSGSVSFSERPVERELSWTCEIQSTDREYELSL